MMPNQPNTPCTACNGTGYEPIEVKVNGQIVPTTTPFDGPTYTATYEVADEPNQSKKEEV